MFWLLFLLFICSIVLFVLGIVKPSLFSGLRKSPPNRVKLGLIFGVLMIALFFATALSSVKKIENENLKVDNNENSNVENGQNLSPDNILPPISQEKDKNVDNPEYRIVKEINGKRYDNGVVYLVLIEKVDLSNDDFKNHIKTFVNSIAKEKGLKISIDFFDEESTLELYYKSHYGENSLERPLEKKETEEIGNHLIASFSGELKTDLFFNTLSFFPGNVSKNSETKNFIENIEYSPN